MSTNAGTDLCRVTIIGPSRRVDLALPVVVPLAEVLPQLLRHAGETAQSPDEAHAGWVLQRLGEPPLDATRRVSALQIRDGELLYLRPREEAAPELAFDDLVDAIATSAGFQAPWTAVTTRRTTTALALAALATAAAVLLSAGPPWTVPSAVLLGLAVVAGLVAAAASRVVGNVRLGGAVGLAAVGLAALGGLVLPGGDVELVDVGASHLLGAAACAGALATLMLLATAASTHTFAVVAVVAGVAAAAAAGRLFLADNAADVAAVVAALALALTPLVPVIGFRVARLRLPLLPRGVVDLTAEDDLPGPDVLEQATTAARVVRDLLVVSVVVLVASAGFLAFDPGWAGPTLAAICALALLLRTRLFAALTARLALVLGGAAVGALVALGRFAAAPDLTTTLVGTGVLAVLAGGMIAYAGRRQARRPGPWAGRLADILEGMVVLAVVPVVLAVLDLYAWVRALAG